jgi:hypothetical protein
MDNPAFGVPHAALLRQLAQIARVESGVEMIGIGDVGQWRVCRRIRVPERELAARRHDCLQRILADRRRAPGEELLEPELMERQGPERTTDDAKAMDVAIADSRPVLEMDAELDRALRTLDEFGLIDAERLPVERADVRHAGLTHTYDSDFFGLDQANRGLLAEVRGQRRRGHPSGAAAADHDHALDPVVCRDHFVHPLRRRATGFMCRERVSTRAVGRSAKIGFYSARARPDELKPPGVGQKEANRANPLCIARIEGE